MAAARHGEFRGYGGARLDCAVHFHGGARVGSLAYRTPDAEKSSTRPCFASLWLRRIAGWRFVPCRTLRTEAGAFAVAEQRYRCVAEFHVLSRDGYLDCCHADPLVRLHGLHFSTAHGSDPGAKSAIRFAKIVQLSLSCLCFRCGFGHTGVFFCIDRVAGLHEYL